MSRDLPCVAVLLSTYNGEAHLREQLDSLRAQTGVAVDLFVRDDGSSDKTLDVLRAYSSTWPQLVDLRSSENLGPGRSFLELLSTAPGQYAYWAFSDQDDLWRPDKLARAVRALSNAPADKPALYCSQFTCADENLNPTGLGPGDADTRFEHLLFENIAWGCTIVMNTAARALVAERLPKNSALMHDWWCATAVSALGVVIYDPEPSLLYRQHSRNAIGLQSQRLQQVWNQARLFLKNPGGFYSVHAQATELLEVFGARLQPGKLKTVRELVASRRSVGARMAYAIGGPISRRRLSDALVARALVAGGWY